MTFARLPRREYHHVNDTCPAPNRSGPRKHSLTALVSSLGLGLIRTDPIAIVPVAAGLTFQHLVLIIAGMMTMFSCLLSFLLIMRHATHYSVPIEQKQ